MEITQLVALIFLFAMFAIAIVALVFIELAENQPPTPTIVYSKKEVALADFLETHQAVNEDFLTAQNELLKATTSQSSS